MSFFEPINQQTKEAVKSGEKFLKYSEEYFNLKIFRQVSFSISMILKVLAIGVLILIAIIFLAISGAIALGDQLNSLPLGIVIVGVGFLLLAGLVYLFRKKIDKKIIRVISESYFK
jgi:NADH:ubiquinone oxidoreductase subunit 6 (subunit J)